MSQTVRLTGWIDTGTGRQAAAEVEATVQNGVIVAPGGGEAVIVVNNTSANMARDALVYVSGVTGGVLEVALADADDADKPAMFYLPAALLAGATGLAYKSGLSVATLNTLAAGAVDDPVYLDAVTPGNWTLTPPTGSDDSVQVVGRVAVDSATVGQIMWALSGERDVGTNELQDLAVTTGKIANLAVEEGKLGAGAVTNAKLGDDAVTGPKITNAAFGLQGVAAVEVDHAAGSPFEILVADANNDRVALVYVVATEAAAGNPDIDIGTAGTHESVVADFKAGAWAIGDRALYLVRIPAAENLRATINAAGTAGKLDIYVHIMTPVVQTANIADNAVTGIKIPAAALGYNTVAAVEVDHAAASPFEILAANGAVGRIALVTVVATEDAAGAPDIDIGVTNTINSVVDDFGVGLWTVGQRATRLIHIPAGENVRATIAAAGTAGKLDVYVHVLTPVMLAANIADNAVTDPKLLSLGAVRSLGGRDCARSAVGYFYLTGAAADTETVVIQGRTYEFDTNAAITGDVTVDITADQTADAAITALVAAINADGTRTVDAIAWAGNSDVSSGCSFIHATGGAVNPTLVETCGNGTVSAAACVGAAALANRDLWAFSYTVTAQDVTTLALAAGNSVIIAGFPTTVAPTLAGLVCRTAAGVVKSLATVQFVLAQVNANFIALTVDDGAAVLATGDVIGFTLLL